MMNAFLNMAFLALIHDLKVIFYCLSGHNLILPVHYHKT